MWPLPKELGLGALAGWAHLDGKARDHGVPHDHTSGADRDAVHYAFGEFSLLHDAAEIPNWAGVYPTRTGMGKLIILIRGHCKRTSASSC